MSRTFSIKPGPGVFRCTLFSCIFHCIYLLIAGMGYAPLCTYRGQRKTFGSRLFSSSMESTLGQQAWRQVPFFIESSHKPIVTLLTVLFQYVSASSHGPSLQEKKTLKRTHVSALMPTASHATAALATSLLG